MKFERYDWDDTSYWNAKYQIYQETTAGTKYLQGLRRHGHEAYEESVEYDSGNTRFFGIERTNAKLMRGDVYKEWATGKDLVQYPVGDKPVIKINNPEYWTAGVVVETVGGTGMTYACSITPTVAASALVEQDGEDAVPIPEITVSGYYGKSVTPEKSYDIDFEFFVGYYIEWPMELTLEYDEAIDPPTLDFGNDNNITSYTEAAEGTAGLMPSLDLKEFLLKYQLEENLGMGISHINDVNKNSTQHTYSLTELSGFIDQLIEEITGYEEVQLTSIKQPVITTHTTDVYGTVNTRTFAGYDKIILSVEEADVGETDNFVWKEDIPVPHISGYGVY